MFHSYLQVTCFLSHLCQIENVKNVQDALKGSLQELETTKNPDELQFLDQQVKELKEKSDQMIVVLKVELEFLHIFWIFNQL